MPNIGTSLIAFRLPLAGWLLLIVTALLAAFSVRWGIVHDAALMFYVGREVAAGARSVVDIFDVNMPLVYWIHAGIWLAIGMNELAWRACDAAMMAGICVLGWRLIAPLAGSLTPVAILMIVARHLSYGAELPGQRDVMMLLALLASTVLLVRWVERGRGHFDALGAGILVGVALNIKPVAALYAPLLLSAVALAAGPFPRPDPRTLLLLAFDVAVGAAMPCLAVAAILHAQGVLPAFVEFWLAFMVPAYRTVPTAVSALVDPIWVTSFALATIGVVAVLGGALRDVDLSRSGSRLALLIAVTAASLVEYLLQGKGFLYQAAPFNYTAILLGATLLAALGRSGAPGERAHRILITTFLVALVLRVGLVLVLEGIRSADGPRSPPKYVQSMIDDLGQHVPAGWPVQSLDVAYGANAAILRTGRRQPTRFMYDIQFFIGHATPYRAALRTEFLAKLAAAGPHALLISNEQWPGPQGFDRFDQPQQWPELVHRIATRYELVVERREGFIDHRQYRIYRSLP